LKRIKTHNKSSMIIWKMDLKKNVNLFCDIPP
jgi:hypothetical protein